jgi:hypothetical protein
LRVGWKGEAVRTRLADSSRWIFLCAAASLAVVRSRVLAMTEVLCWRMSRSFPTAGSEEERFWMRSAFGCLPPRCPRCAEEGGPPENPRTNWRLSSERKRGQAAATWTSGLFVGAAPLVS